MLQIREKKKWKKYPCTVRNDCFIQFKDPKVSHIQLLTNQYTALMWSHVFWSLQCHHEHFKLGVQDFDVFAGIEGSKIDVKNPLPTR